MARRVAESVSLSAAVPVRLPFTLGGRLAGLAPVRTWVVVCDDADPIDASRWTAEVDLAPDGVAAFLTLVDDPTDPAGWAPVR